MAKKAFTLAEVLITLAIIGIVAALTIPSVISNYQQQEFKTGLKKAVSVLNEAIQINIAQEGETPYDNIKQDFGKIKGVINGNLYEYLQRHMSIIKKTNISRCASWRVYNGNDQCTLSGSGNKAFYTTDGMRFEFSNQTHAMKLHESNVSVGVPQQMCGHPSYSYECYSYYNASCGSYGLNHNPNDTKMPPCLVMVDVNGDRGPNSPTKNTKNSHYNNGSINTAYANQYTFPSPSDKKIQDVFNIMITDEKAIPYGVVAQRAMYSK